MCENFHRVNWQVKVLICIINCISHATHLKRTKVNRVLIRHLNGLSRVNKKSIYGWIIWIKRNLWVSPEKLARLQVPTCRKLR